MPRLLPLVLALALLLLALGGCRTVSPKQRELSRVQFELAVQALSTGDYRAALGEVERSLETDPDNADAHNLHGLVLHLYYSEVDRALAAYRRALELKPNYAEAKVNLGAALMVRERWAEAMPFLEEARKDMLYREAFLAEGNLGWCHYKLGDTAAALKHLNAAVQLNPGFCLGYRNLAEIHQEAGQLELALKNLDRFAKACPAEPDAERRRALVLLRSGAPCEARAAFQACLDKAKEGQVFEDCAAQQRLVPTEGCAPPPPPPPAPEEP